MEPQMATCSENAPEQATSYRSPWRVLARAFEKSRDRWKSKYQVLQERIKAFRTEVRDLRRSRDRWQAKAEALKQQRDDLRAAMRQRVEPSPPALSQPSAHFPTRHSR
jgi:septal ring factor EnvC (AmiA/AmiB activator)